MEVMPVFWFLISDTVVYIEFTYLAYARHLGNYQLPES